jgi:hypothetical protein
MSKDQAHLLLAAAMVTMQNMPKAEREPLRDACLAFVNSELTEQVRAANQWRTDCLTYRGF